MLFDLTMSSGPEQSYSNSSTTSTRSAGLANSINMKELGELSEETEDFSLVCRMNRTNESASAVDAPDQSEASTSKDKTESGSAIEAQPNVSGTRRRTAFSDSESDSDLGSDLSRDDLVKLVAEKEHLLVTKEEELGRMKDKVPKTSADMENVKERTRRESENAKKFAIQNFAKSLLDVADNLGLFNN